MDNLKIGKFINKLRKEKNMTQKELADKLYITDKAISKWERGLSIPDVGILPSLASILGVEVSEILNGKKIDKEPKKDYKKVKKIIGIISMIIFVFLTLIQTKYLFVLNKRGYEYVIDILFYIINEIIILSFLLSMLFLIKTKIKNIYLYIFVVIISTLNILFMFNKGLNNKSIISFSNNFKNQLVLKINKKTGMITLYKNATGLFAKKKEVFTYSLDKDIKNDWLEEDINAITYKDTDGSIREFVVTYGTRKDSMNYYSVLGSLYGTWQVFTQYGDNTKMIVDSKGITLEKSNITELYTSDNIKQFGTLAIVLYKNDLPKYVIGLNKDCKINDNTNRIEKNGTISLQEISLDKEIKEVLSSTTPKNSENYNIVDMDAYDYKINNGILYVSYDEKNIVEVPGEYKDMLNSYNDYNYQISEYKTVFFYNLNNKRYLVYSSDKGKTFDQIEINSKSSIQNIHFINSSVGFMLEFLDAAMGTTYGQISKTTDGGKTWNIVGYGINSGGQQIFKMGSQIKFIDENIGFLTMPYNGESCDLYITKDSGKTFKKIELKDELLPNKENLSWEDVYDFYNLPNIKNNSLALEIGQGSDGDYNGGDSVYYISDDKGDTWDLKVD